jgi:hypothetical protein
MFFLYLFHLRQVGLLASQRPLDETDSIALGTELLLCRLQLLSELVNLFAEIPELARLESHISFLYC